MKLGPRYKIARRVGAQIFEKTQTQKFAIRSSGRAGGGRRGRGQTDFARGLLEKQRARFMYGIPERQFAKYAREAARARSAEEALFERLETRLDNAVYRLGIAPTRSAARQMVSHGHVTVNGRRVTIPSYNLSIGEKIGIRAGSAGKKIFSALAEDMKTRPAAPTWLSFDLPALSGEVIALPKLSRAELLFNLRTILEFYRR